MQLALPSSIGAPRSYRIALCFFFFIQGFAFASWASRIPDIKNTLHLSDGKWGFILLGLPVGQLSAMGMSGYLVTRFGSRQVLGIACFLYPAALTLLGLATSWPLLMAALFLFGVCGNMMNISVNTQAAGVERLYRRAIMAAFHGVWSLAGFFGGIFSTLIVANKIDPFHHFCIVFAMVFIPVLIARRHLMPRDAQSAVKRKVFVKPDKGLLILGMIAFSCMICEGTMFDWSGIYFDSVVKVPHNLTRLGYIAFMCTMAGGRFMADILITKFGPKRMIKASGIIIFTGMMTAVAFPYLPTATIGFLLVGMGVSSVVPLSYSLAARSGTMAPGVAIAAVSSVGYLGFLSGPTIIGFIAELSSLRGSFLLIGCLGLGTTILAGKIRPASA